MSAARIIHSVLFLFLYSQFLWAQEQFFFTNYTPDDGLSSQSIRTVVKDHDGFLWVGTDAGLNRFNGHDFTVFKSLASDSTTLTSNTINHLLTDHSGRLWISTFQGPCLYVKNKNVFRRLGLSKSGNAQKSAFECRFIFEDSKQNIWAGSSGEGLLKYDPYRDCFIQAFILDSALSMKNVSAMLEDSDGTIWVTTSTHLIHINPSTHAVKVFECRVRSKGNTTFQSVKIFPDGTNADYLWIGTWGNGIVHFNKQSATFSAFKFEENAPVNIGNIIFDILPQKNNKLWLATNKGLIVFDAARMSYEGIIFDSLNERPVVNTQVQSICKDEAGIVWLGTAFGLCNINPSKQVFVKDPLWINAGVSTVFFDESSDKIYGVRFYNNRALIIYNCKTKSTGVYHIPEADQLMAEPFAVFKDSRGLVWIGTTKGVYTFNEAQKKFRLLDLHTTLGIPDRSVYAGDIHEDRAGDIWIASYRNGLLRIDRNTQKIKTYVNNAAINGALQVYGVKRIIQGDGNSIYVMGDTYGVAKLDIEKDFFENYNTSVERFASLSTCTDMALDREGGLWITTKNNGLVHVDKNKQVTAYIKDDFGNLVDEQQSIVVDESGKIWLTASNGLYQFDPSKKSFLQFTTQDGLPQRNISLLPNRLRDGKIAFVFRKGIFSFSPERLIKREAPLGIHLTSLLVNGKKSSFSPVVDVVDTIRLSHTENTLTFEFDAINFTNPSSTVYSCFLEGVDKQWSSPGRSRVINYSQLRPGNYNLRIRSGVDKIWNYRNERALFIQIIPAWWQTAWFRWMMVFVSIGAIVFIVRLFLSLRYRQRIAQLERLREIESIRSRISRDIHDEIGSGLTKIKLMSRNLLKKSEGRSTGNELSKKISLASDELIQNLGEIVWTINPSNDSLANIIAYIRSYVFRLFEENPELKLNLELPESPDIPSDLLINPEVKRNLILILKEALTNIFKHAQATEVFVSLKLDKSAIRMLVRDNGNGIFESHQDGSGNGIKNMSKRAETIQAQLTVESVPGNGTAINLIIPIHAS